MLAAHPLPEQADALDHFHAAHHRPSIAPPSITLGYTTVLKLYPLPSPPLFATLPHRVPPRCLARHSLPPQAPERLPQRTASAPRLPPPPPLPLPLPVPGSPISAAPVTSFAHRSRCLRPVSDHWRVQTTLRRSSARNPPGRGCSAASPASPARLVHRRCLTSHTLHTPHTHSLTHTPLTLARAQHSGSFPGLARPAYPVSPAAAPRKASLRPSCTCTCTHPLYRRANRLRAALLPPPHPPSCVTITIASPASTWPLPLSGTR